MKQRAIMKNKESGEVKAVPLNESVRYKQAGWENSTEGEYDAYRAKVGAQAAGDQFDDGSDDWRKDVKSIEAFAKANRIEFPVDVKKKPEKIDFIEKTLKGRANGGGSDEWREGSAEELIKFAEAKNVNLEGVSREDRDALIGVIDAALASGD